jgi:hypothetical protein
MTSSGMDIPNVLSLIVTVFIVVKVSFGKATRVTSPIYQQSYEKSRAGQNEFTHFSFRDGVTSP